jgi:hypothetical protein
MRQLAELNVLAAMYMMYIVMTRMVRKQVYIRKDQDSRLRRTAKDLGVTESEIIRRGIDHETAEVQNGPRDPQAWAELMEFVKKRAQMKVPQTGRSWTRDELYEDD